MDIAAFVLACFSLLVSSACLLLLVRVKTALIGSNGGGSLRSIEDWIKTLRERTHAIPTLQMSVSILADKTHAIEQHLNFPGKPLHLPWMKPPTKDG